MTWTKLGNEFLPESKVLSDAAYRCHVDALMWSNWRLLDLVINRRDLPMFATPTSGSADDAVEELITAGWWQLLDDDHYWIGCKFSEWQQDKAQVEHRRAQLALAQRRKRLHDIGDHKLCIPGRCKALSTVDSTVESCDDPVRLRNGPVTGTPKTKPSLEEEGSGTGTASGNGHRSGAAGRVAGSVSVVQGMRCEACGSAGPLRMDEFDRPVCVGRCVQDE
jgi:hypothetical protein